jgi:hypothetical protein
MNRDEFKAGLTALIAGLSVLRLIGCFDGVTQGPACRSSARFHISWNYTKVW